MNVGHIYDAHVAHRFDEDPFDLYRGCRELALDQIRRNVEGGAVRIADLGCGTGEFLAAVAGMFPKGSLCGIDSSEKMLEIARAKLGEIAGARVRLVRDDILNLDRYVEPGGSDLVVLHFALTRVDVRKLLALVHHALRPGGWCSLATGTHETFLTLRRLASAFVSEEFIRSSCSIPEDRGELQETLREAGLQVVEEAVHRKTVRWTEFETLSTFLRHSGWFPHPAITELSESEIEGYREALQPFFPIEDVAEKAVLLVRKD